jgi:two-component system response regulator NreC
MDERAPNNIGVFLAEDHVVVREGIALILESADDMTVVGEAGDGWQTVEGVQRSRPDVVLMDIDMPGLSGIDATRRIAETCPEVPVIMLTVYEREDLLSRSLEAGAKGYVLKTAGVDELITAIRTVHSGDVYIHSPMTTKLVGDYVNRLRGGQGDDLYEKLSARERQVLPMLAEGRTVKEIGDVLRVSPYTIQTYRQRIMQKLGIHRSNELLMYALRRGLVHLEP